MSPLARARFALSFGVAFFAAKESISAEPVPHDIAYDLRVDAPIIGGSLAFLGFTLLLPSVFAPETCRWCDRDGEIDTLNGFDRTVREGLRYRDSNRNAANILSYATIVSVGAGSLALGALGAGGSSDPLKTFAVDTMIIAESTLLAVDINQVVKAIAARERPFVHVLAPEDRGKTDHPLDNNVSFFSGHSTTAFAIAASAGTVGMLRGYRFAPWIYASGGALAATTAYLRIAADKHYASDVLIGSAFGIASGVLVPLLLHPRQRAATESSPNVQVTSIGAFSVSGAF